MAVRKCPACKKLVTAAPAMCPYCGVNFRAILIRRIVLVLAGIFVLWVIAHFGFKVI